MFLEYQTNKRYRLAYVTAEKVNGKHFRKSVSLFDNGIILILGRICKILIKCHICYLALIMLTNSIGLIVLKMESLEKLSNYIHR